MAESIGEETPQVSGPDTEETIAESTETLSEEPKTPPVEKQDTVPYEKFAETRRELQELRQLVMSQRQETPQTPPATEEVAVPRQYILEDGSLDLPGYTSWLTKNVSEKAAASAEERVAKRLDFEKQNSKHEQREEEDLFREYPELKGDAKRIKLVKALKNQALLEGQYVPLVEAAKDVAGLTNDAVEKAKKSLTETRTIQQNAAAPQASAKVNAQDAANADLRARMESPNSRVREEARREWLLRRIETQQK